MFVLGLKGEKKKEKFVKKIIVVLSVCPLRFLCFNCYPQMMIRGGTFQEV